MGDSAHTTHHTNLGKKSAPPLFLEDENISQKIGLHGCTSTAISGATMEADF
jgi:hypothetical protein